MFFDCKGRLAWLVCGLIFLTGCGNKTLFINEISLMESKLIRDESGKNDDWLELYNSSSRPRDLAGMYLTDNRKKLTKWKFPGKDPEVTTIPGKGFLIVWMDKDIDEGPLHTNFRLDNGGDMLWLVDKDGSSILDSVAVAHMPESFTFCREEDGRENWVFIKRGSPGEQNSLWKDSISLAAVPEIGPEAGLYSEKIDVKITAPNSGYEIWYTLDGSSPSSDSGFKFTKSFSIDTTVVVKARLIKKGYLPGPIVTSTYLLHDHFTLPVISISLNPADLWNEEYGLYTMYHRPYEKPAHFEYFSPEGKLKLGLDLGLRITGYTSRILPKKSFRILARDKYGPNNLEYHFFKDIENDKFGGLVIRADVTAAQGGGPHEIAGERIKNEIIYRFNRDMHSTVDMQAYQPVVVFLNGKYWGLYTLMERKAGEFIRNHHDVGEVDLIDDEDLDVMEGDDKHYIKMLSIMNNEDIRDPAVYAKIEGMMEIENFIDNWIYNIYMNAFDHEVNTRCWRPKTPEGKWHWIAFDKDGWGEYYESLLKDLAEIEVAEANLILGRLLKNEKFKLHFINRTCDYLNTVMRPEMVNRYIDEIAEVIKNEKPRDRKLWFEKVKYIVTGEQIAWMKEFGEKRPEHLRNEMRKIFKLPLEATLTFSSSPPGSGIIKVSTITPYAFPWTGVYFRETPIRLEAIPSPGYHFGEWNVNGASKESLISYIPKGDTEIKALFSK